MALIVGVALPCIETWRRWNVLRDWPAWFDDYLAAGLLLYAWYTGRHASASTSRPYLMAAWGYTLGLAYVSFFGQWKAGFAAADPSGLPVAGVLAFKASGLAIAAVCLALTWAAPNEGAT